MSNAIDDRETVLLTDLAAVEGQIRTVRAWLSDPDNISALTTSVEGSRAQQESRLGQLLKEEARLIERLGQLPVENIYKVNVAVNVIGLDTGKDLIPPQGAPAAGATNGTFSIANNDTSVVLTIPGMTGTGQIVITQLTPTGNPGDAIYRVAYAVDAATVTANKAPGVGNAFNAQWTVSRYS